MQILALYSSHYFLSHVKIIILSMYLANLFCVHLLILTRNLSAHLQRIKKIAQSIPKIPNNKNNTMLGLAHDVT
jgi:hypothetical protein